MNLDNAYASLPLPIRKRLKLLMMRLLKPKLNRFYSQLLQGGDLLFDIGANDGDYTEIFLELGGTVISIDPQPECIEKMMRKFSKTDKVTIIQGGVGEINGMVDFHVSSFNSPNSTFSAEFRTHSRYNYRTWDKVMKVRMYTLNTLIRKYGLPYFCKIDVEGYEWEVLSTLQQPIPVISFEFLTELNQKSFKIIHFLDSLGKCSYNLCLGMRYSYESKNWLRGKEMVSWLTVNQSRKLYGDIYVKFE